MASFTIYILATAGLALQTKTPGVHSVWSAKAHGVTDQEIKRSAMELGWARGVRLRVPIVPYEATEDQDEAEKDACRELLLATELRVGRKNDSSGKAGASRMLSLPLRRKATASGTAIRARAYPLVRLTHYPRLIISGELLP